MANIYPVSIKAIGKRFVYHCILLKIFVNIVILSVFEINDQYFYRLTYTYISIIYFTKYLSLIKINTDRINRSKL